MKVTWKSSMCQWEEDREREEGRERKKERESWYLKSCHDTISDGHQITNCVHSIEQWFLVFLLYGVTGLSVTEWERNRINSDWPGDLCWRNWAILSRQSGILSTGNQRSGERESEKRKGEEGEGKKKKKDSVYFNGVSGLRDLHVQSNDPSFLESVPGCPHSSFEASNCFQCYVREKFDPTFPTEE